MVHILAAVDMGFACVSNISVMVRMMKTLWDRISMSTLTSDRSGKGTKCAS